MENKKKKFLILIFIFTFWIVAFSGQSVHAAGTGVDGLFPDKSTLNITSTQVDLSNKYQLTHYSFDSKKFGILDSWAYPIKALTNVFFLITAFLSYIIDYLLMACFKFNIFSMISTGFNDIVWAARDSIFLPMLDIIAPLIGITLIFNAAVGKFQSVWRIVGNTVIVILIAYGFFANPSYVMTMVNDMSQSVSGSMLSGAAKVTSGTSMSSDDAVINLGNSFWQNTVLKPWQIIEFGNANATQADVDKYLNSSTSDDARKTLADAEAKKNDLFSADGQALRLVMVIFMGLISMIMALLVATLAILTIMLQFGAIVCAVIGVLAFALALLPNMGLKVAVNSLYNTFGFLLGKIGMTVILVLYFSVNSVLFKLTATYGWFFITILQVIFLGTIVMYRKKIMGFAHSATSGSQGAIANINRSGDNLKNLGKAAFGLYGAKKVIDDVNVMRETRKDKKLGEKYKQPANEFLKQRYTNEKKAAETRAEKEDKPVEYSDFVKRVESRVDKGFSAFDTRDVDGTVNMMKTLHREGNDPTSLLTTKINGKEDETIKFKQADLEKSVEHDSADLDKRTDINKDKIRRNIRMNKDSKLYSRKEVIINALSGNLDKTGLMRDINLSSNHGGAIKEINKDRADTDYDEMKKREAVMESEKVEEQQELKVVNYHNERPGGNALLGSTERINSNEVNRALHMSGGNTIEAHRNNGANEINDRSNEVNGIVEGVTKRRTRRGTSDVNNENNKNINNVTESHKPELTNVATNGHNDVSEMSEKGINGKTEKIERSNNINNGEEVVNSSGKDNQNINETHKVEATNVINEHKTVSKARNKVTNRNIKNVEHKNNISNKDENINTLGKENQNINETHKVEASNVINEHKTVNKAADKVTNRNIKNVEHKNNISNKDENINSSGKENKNINETHKVEATNVINEHKTVNKAGDKVTNRNIKNVEQKNNISNKEENINSSGKDNQNINETHKVEATNVINEHKTVNKAGDKVTNRNIKNVEQKNNISNREEIINSSGKNTQNIDETHKSDVSNTKNEHKVVNKTVENKTNRSIKNTESKINVTNKTKDINNTSKNTENVSEKSKRATKNVTTKKSNVKNIKDNKK